MSSFDDEDRLILMAALVTYLDVNKRTHNPNLPRAQALLTRIVKGLPGVAPDAIAMGLHGEVRSVCISRCVSGCPDCQPHLRAPILCEALPGAVEIRGEIGCVHGVERGKNCKKCEAER